MNRLALFVEPVANRLQNLAELNEDLKQRFYRLLQCHLG